MPSCRDPNLPETPVWPSLTAEEDIYMEIALTEDRVLTSYRPAVMRFWEHVVPKELGILPDRQDSDTTKDTVKNKNEGHIPDEL